jgi:hypothetical protein
MEDTYKITPIPEKGLGVIATRDFTRGTRIISERPLFKIEQHASKLSEELIVEQLRTLTRDQQHIFFSLSNSKPNPQTPFTAIVGTNSFKTSSNEVAAVFNELSRINHACNPNMMTLWDEEKGTMAVMALKDIGKGEELTISYLGGLPRYEARQKALKANYNFECQCWLCSLSTEQRHQSDNRRERITDIIHRMDKPTYQDLRLALRLLGEEGILSGQRIDDVYFRAASLAIVKKDKCRAMIFSYRGRGRELESSDPEDEFKQVHDVIKGRLGEKGMEEWLWAD